MSTQKIRTNPRAGGGAGYEVWAPFDIGPRLEPCLKLEDGSRISIAFVGYRDDEDGDKRPYYTWAVDDAHGVELATGDDLSGPSGGVPDVEAVFHSFASFVGAWVESVGGENSDLFPEPMREWADANYEELWLRLSSAAQG